MEPDENIQAPLTGTDVESLPAWESKDGKGVQGVRPIMGILDEVEDTESS